MPRLLVAHTELCKTKITCRHIEGRGKRGHTVEEQSLEDGQGKHCTGFPAWSWRWCLRWCRRWWGWWWWCWWWGWRWCQSTCLLVQSVPASAPLSGLPPPPSPCSPASTCYWTILSMIGYHGFTLTGSRLTRWKAMHFMDPFSLLGGMLNFHLTWFGLILFCFSQFGHSSFTHLTPGEHDEEHGDEHHEQLKEPLDHPLPLLRVAYSCSHRLVSHFLSLYLKQYCLVNLQVQTSHKWSQLVNFTTLSLKFHNPM